jgi:hypothetical protein
MQNQKSLLAKHILLCWGYTSAFGLFLEILFSFRKTALNGSDDKLLAELYVKQRLDYVNTELAWKNGDATSEF